MGILTEHYAGAFPAWLAPVQAMVLPVASDQVEYAESVLQKLREAGIRADMDRREEKIGYKIRDAELQKVPYMLVVGARESESGQVSVRAHSRGNLGARPLDEFLVEIIDETRVRH